MPDAAKRGLIGKREFKIAGFFLLVSGWMLTLCALVLLPGSGSRSAFIGAGTIIDLLGLALVVYGHMPKGEQE